MSGYRPKSFELYELVPPEIFHGLGERGWELLDARALLALQAIRDRFGAIVVNNWQAGGSFSESGLRTAASLTGAKYSQHRYGRAFDCKCESATPAEIAAYILAHPEEFPQLTCLENPKATVTWLHIDTRNHQREGVWIVNP
jgi:hypothetical protein